MLGSMTQYQGLSQGLLFDPPTLAPLMPSPAMERALRLYARLAAIMPDAPAVPNSETAYRQPVFAGGHCAMAFRWAGALSVTERLHAERTPRRRLAVLCCAVSAAARVALAVHRARQGSLKADVPFGVRWLPWAQSK